MAAESAVGVVAIGRNEGERLVRCLASVVGRVTAVVYVDSGSTDASVARAEERGVHVVRLDMSVPFTAARARNAGYRKLLELHPALPYVQFVDGDCELRPEWLEVAHAHLEANPTVAVVCGRRRERYPDESIFNRLADMEWNTPVGQAEACGGDAMMRASVLCEVGGYNATLIAGEEPELCLRIRRSGRRIVRLDCEMTLHDAALVRWQQWWRRAVRSGHAFAESVYLHGRSPDRYHVRELRSIVFWGGVVPAVAFGLALPTAGASLLVLGGYPVLFWRIVRRRRALGDARRDAALYAAGCVVGKFAELRGAAQFAFTRLLLRRASQIIEYKQPPVREARKT